MDKTIVRCDMTRDCDQPVTHVDAKGYVYCSKHGHQRKQACRCRMLSATELKQIERGEPLRKY